ncbi:MAG: RsmB/NOP family class I SAM-dependent RNA methyltransferase [Limnochordales bacterium]|nr:RsmB/NOP family class I SAM-dependent RNA methyltransferase [Limnochordales bacterium]
MAEYGRVKSLSINDVLRHLPRDFIDRLYADFPALLVERILRGFAVTRPVTLRVNRLRVAANPANEGGGKEAAETGDLAAAVRAELAAQGIATEPVAWYADALVVTTPGVRERDLAKTSAYQEGRIYLQSLSSMLPPLVLAPQPGERVLDLTAAPGSKTTQMAALMGNAGEIVACDKNPIRLGRLQHNLRVQGVTIARTVQMDATQFGRGPRAQQGSQQGPRPGRQQFDRVLLDAPCSGEGLFLLEDPRSYQYWTPAMVERMAALQRRLFVSAWEALRPGGVLVYSTCTLSRAENEDLIAWALRQFGSKMEIEPCQIQISRAAGLSREALLTEVLPEAMAAGTDGTGRRLDGYPPAVGLAVRILPSELMEGFFICRLRKRGD